MERIAVSCSVQIPLIALSEDLTKGIKPETNAKSYKKKLRPLSKKIPVRSTMKEERTTMIKPKGKKPKKISGRSTFR